VQSACFGYSLMRAKGTVKLMDPDPMWEWLFLRRGGHVLSRCNVPLYAFCTHLLLVLCIVCLPSICGRQIHRPLRGVTRSVIVNLCAAMISDEAFCQITLDIHSSGNSNFEKLYFSF